MRVYQVLSFFAMFYPKIFANKKNIRTFALAIGNQHRGNKDTGFSGT